MAPIKAWETCLRVAESFRNASQSPHMLAGDCPNLLAPSFVAVSTGSRARFDQGSAPVRNDFPFFPIGLADQCIPLSDKRFRHRQRLSVKLSSFRRKNRGVNRIRLSFGVIQKCWRWCHVHSLRENRNHQNVFHLGGNAFLCPLRVQHRLAPTNA